MTEKDARLELAEINSKLKYYDYLYHNKGSSVVADSDYDLLKQKKCQILEEYQILKLYDDYADKVGAPPDSRLKKINHRCPMLSLDKAFNREDIEKFLSKVKRFLNIKNNDDLTMVCEPKIDGLSFSLIYINGLFFQASTRGDGYYGEEITKNVATLSNLPKIIENAPEVLEVRGEIYLDHATFTKMNEKSEFSNPRNAVAGSIRQLDFKITESRNLKYFAYSIVNVHYTTQKEVLSQLQQWNFTVNNNIAIVDTVEEMIKYYEKIYDNRSTLDYDIDGVVYKVNNIKLQEKLGSTSHAPRWAIAYKFPAIEGKTILERISVQVGRTGVLTPIAELVPINIGGVIVRRASLHNKDEIERKDIREGDYVVVKRAGDVIPQLVDVDKKLRPKSGLKKFTFPEKCPICGSHLQKMQDKVAVRCTGELFCKAQILEKIEHFASRDAFNIIGFGKKQIEFFYRKNLIVKPIDIFTLRSRVEKGDISLSKCHGWGKKSIDNLLKSIDSSKVITLERFIFALGIRFIGKNTAQIIAEHYVSYNNWYSSMIDLVNCGDNNMLSNISGVGLKVIDSLKDFFYEFRNIEMINELYSNLNIIDFKREVTNNTSLIANKTIVFTGTLLKMSRSEAKVKAENLGAKIAVKLSSSTDFLIVGTTPGSKYKEAQKLNVPILTEDQWLEIIDKK